MKILIKYILNNENFNFKISVYYVYIQIWKMISWILISEKGLVLKFYQINEIILNKNKIVLKRLGNSVKRDWIKNQMQLCATFVTLDYDFALSGTPWIFIFRFCQVKQYGKVAA